MAKPPLTQQELARLLREAEHAHGEYEATLGHRDDDWPDWYATYIITQLEIAQLEKAKAPAKPSRASSARPRRTSRK
jgi:hypothetical protein